MSRDHSTMFYEGLPVHHVLAMGDYTFFWPLGHVILCAGQPVYSPPYVLACVVFTLFLFDITFLVISHVFLPLRAAKAKAPSITERY